MGYFETAIAAKVASRLWEIGDIVDVLEAWEAVKIEGRGKIMAGTYPDLPWLDASIEVLLRQPRGTAHVDKIVDAIKRWKIKNPKNTIVRTLNTYCSNAGDYDPEKPDLFERVAPNTFRLRRFPERPDTRFAVKEAQRAAADAFIRELLLLDVPQSK